MRLGVRRRLFSTMAAVGAVWALTVAIVGGQAAPPAAPAPSATMPRPPMSDEVFKNIQVLKGIPLDQFMGTMGFFSASTGLNCTDCHTDESGGNWARYADDNDLKRTARRMVLMVQNINRTNFGGRQVVTCTTCHRGNSRPAVMPSLNLLYATPPPDEPGDPFTPASGRTSADQVIAKYIAAAGGAQRLAAVTSLVGKGTYIGFDDADKTPLELYANAQGQRAIVAHLAAGDSTWTVDGQTGWIVGPPTDRPVPLIDITGQDLEGLKVEVDAFFPARLTQGLRNIRIGLPAVLEDDREVQLVQGDTPGGGVVTLCFDATTGLLVRLIRYAESPVGRLVTRVDYAAYRDVGGIKVPSKWTVSWLSGRSVYELTDIQANSRIPATRFARPALARN
jgi:photosynthetic reaction center cytochrome c subunit